MATTNLTLTKAWQLAVSSTATAFLVTRGGGTGRIELATTASDSTAPTVYGHLLESGMGATRALFPTGAIWARLSPTAVSPSGLLIVDAS